MFELDRIFCQRNNETGLIEWFYDAQEKCFGPYASKADAVNEHEKFKRQNLKPADEGGISLFELDRIFCQRNNVTGLMEWFYNAREGCYGPYTSKVAATNGLKKFKQQNIIRSDDGGRSSTKTKLALTPLAGDSIGFIKLNDTKNKRGKDGTL